MSDKPLREAEEALSSFSMMGPETEHLVKGSVAVDIQSMIGMNRTDNALKATVMLTLDIEGQTFSIPIPPELATQIGVHLIEAASTAQTDVLSLEYDGEKGVPTRESIDRLHAIATKRLEATTTAHVKDTHV